MHTFRVAACGDIGRSINAWNRNSGQRYQERSDDARYKAGAPSGVADAAKMPVRC